MAWSKTFDSREAFEAGTDLDGADEAQYQVARAAAKHILDSHVIPEAEVDTEHLNRLNAEHKAVHADVIRRGGTPGPVVVGTAPQARVRIKLSGHKGGVDEVGVTVSQI